MIQIDFGNQPLSNRLPNKNSSHKEKGYEHSLVLVQDQLGLVRIKNPIEYQEMRSKFDWLTETEPTRHLKSVSSMIAEVVCQNKNYNGTRLSSVLTHIRSLLSDKSNEY